MHTRYVALGVMPTMEELSKRQQRIPEIDPSAVLSMLEVMQLSALIRRQVHDVLEHEHRISEGKLRILLVLEQSSGSVKPSVLAEIIGVTKATVSGLLRRLERDHLISRSIAPEDRRSNEVELSAEGRDFLERVMPEHYLRISKLMGKLTRAEQEQLIHLSRKLAAKES